MSEPDWRRVAAFLAGAGADASGTADIEGAWARLVVARVAVGVADPVLGAVLDQVASAAEATMADPTAALALARTERAIRLAGAAAGADVPDA